VVIDISSELMQSKEAMEEKAFMAAQYLQPLAPEERTGIMVATGLSKFIRNQQDESVKRARRMVSRIRKGDFRYAFPKPGFEVARVMAPVFQRAVVGELFEEMEEQAQQVLLQMADYYMKAAAAEEAQIMQQQLLAAQAGGGQQA
jgi:ferritin